MATVAVLGGRGHGQRPGHPGRSPPATGSALGTWLDGDLLAELRAGRPHPRTGVPVDPLVELHDAGGLAAALDGADLVAVAISSGGVLEVARRAAAAGLAPGTPLLLCTKGFGRSPDGRVGLLPDLVAAAMGGRPCRGRPLVAVGGPCKANEVAAGRPTAAVFAGQDGAAVERCAPALETPAYRVERSRDPAGVEAAAATKNVYAIAVGLGHGLGEAGGKPWHDLAAATFTQAVAEMRRLVAALGGRQETVLGLAGLGDLEVTSLSGRNRVLGTRLGRGEPPPGRWPRWPPPARPSRRARGPTGPRPGRPARPRAARGGRRPAVPAAVAGRGQPRPGGPPRPGRPTGRGRPPRLRASYRRQSLTSTTIRLETMAALRS